MTINLTDGPFTNEQLIEQAREVVENIDFMMRAYPGGATESAQMNHQLIKIALTALTAEPLNADERGKIRAGHAEWSRSTFGNVGPVGPLKHLAKEALEAAADPGDLSEWADMQFLLWDAQRNAGITDEQITAAMIAKLEVNKARQWPEPKDGEPRLHIKGTENDA